MFATIINVGPHTATNVALGPKHLRFVAVERCDVTTRSEDEGLFLATVSEVVTSNLGSSLAQTAAELGGRLRADGQPPLPPWVFFVAVDLTDTQITSCVAGPHRVHLIQREAIIASTREHTLVHDDPPPDWPELSKDDLSLHGNVVTRSIGRSCSRLPEVTTWNVEGACRVVVVSAAFYQNREPSEYATTLGPGVVGEVGPSCAVLYRHL